MKRDPSQQASKAKKKIPQPRPDALIDPKVLRDLIDTFQTAGVADMEVERQGLRVRLRRDEALAPRSHEVSVQIPDHSRQPPFIDTPASLLATDRLLTVTSPIVGIFYRSASPETEPYVEEGAYVRKGHVLCIVEAMKLMNEIESEVDGRVVKIFLENAKPVEYGEPLFLIEPGTPPEG